MNKQFSVFSCCGNTWVSHNPTHTHTLLTADILWQQLTAWHHSHYIISQACTCSQKSWSRLKCRPTCTPANPARQSFKIESKNEKWPHAVLIHTQSEAVYYNVRNTPQQDVGQPLWSQTTGYHHGPGNKPVTLVILYHFYFMLDTIICLTL